MGIFPQAQRTESVPQEMYSMRPYLQAELAREVAGMPEIFPGGLHKQAKMTCDYEEAG